MARTTNPNKVGANEPQEKTTVSERETSTTTTNGSGGGIESILKERFVKMSKRLLSESRTDINAWNSDILLTANDNSGMPLFHVVLSARNSDLILWIKPPTLRNGMPLPITSDIVVKIDKLINALQLLKSILPDALAELGISNSTKVRVNMNSDRIEI